MSKTTNKGARIRLKTTLDRLILVIPDAQVYKYGKFREQLEIAETYGKIPRVIYEIGKRASEYHHIIRIGEGSGAIFIGYKHNSAKENQNTYTMKVELNPSAKSSEKVSAARKVAMQILLESFATNAKLIKGLDIAFDVPVSNKDIYAVSLTGKERQTFKDTVYYGASGSSGRLKIYDKKKELEKKQGVEIPEENLTRIEYSIRLKEPVTLQLFSKVENWKINETYQISKLNLGKTDGNIKAYVLAITSGQMELKEFTRAAQVKTKKALENMGLLDLDHEYSNARAEITNTIKLLLSQSNNTILHAI